MRPFNLRNSFLRVAIIALFAMVVAMPTASAQTQGYNTTISQNQYSYSEGVKLYQQGNYEAAIPHFEHTLGMILMYYDKNHKSYPELLKILAELYISTEKYAKAIVTNNLLLEFYRSSKKGEKHPDYAKTLEQLAFCYGSIDNYEKAIEIEEQVLLMLKESRKTESSTYVHTLNNLAANYGNMGDYSKSLDLMKQAVPIFKKLYKEQSNDYATSLANLACSYSFLGDFYKSIELTKQALAICKKTSGENSTDYAYILNLLAVDYGNIGNYTQAIEVYKQSIEIYKQNETDPSYAMTLNNLANCYHIIKDYEKAVQLHTKVLELLKNTVGEQHYYYAQSLTNLAATYTEMGDHAKALTLNLQSLIILKNRLGAVHPHCIDPINNISIIYYKTNRVEQLSSIWRTLFSLSKYQLLSQFRTLTEKHRENLWKKEKSQVIISSLHQYAPLCKTYPEASKIAYNSLLFSKGLILSSSIEFDRVIKASGNEELLAQFEELRTTRAILNTYYNKPIAERPKGEVERLEARAEELEKIMIAGSKEYADFTKYLNVEWENVRDALGENEVAIEFLAAEQFIDETEPYYAAMVLRKGWDAPKYVDLLTAKELKEYCVRGSMMYSGHGAFELYNHIWAKLGEYINEGDNVFFSPDGLLHQINIELFYDVERKRANEKYNLYRVSSTREVCLERETPAQKSAVLYGGLKYNMSNDSLILESNKYDRGEASLLTFRADSTMKSVWSPLPATKVEVENIDAVCHQHNIASNIYATTVGNEESFKALSGKKTPILHLATHGFFYKNEEAKKRSFFEQFDMTGQQSGGKVDNSLKRSGLILAGAQRAWNGEEIPANVEDGILLAEEISTMDLSGTDIVVLSACETGLGEITSDGVFGLQRAFKKAGVKTLIMSLWKVDDEATSLFMQSFYKAWLGGKSKRDAFAFAQKTVREYSDETKSFKNPKFWAAFILLDDYQK